MLSKRTSLRPTRQHPLDDAVRATLEPTFSAARLILARDDQPTVIPGFRVRSNGADAVVRYIQPRTGAPGMRRARACTMLEQYRQALLSQGWQVDLVDEPRRTPFLRCCHTDSVMSIGE